MFFPSFYSEGAGAREIITIGCKYNSTEQGTTTTSGLHDSLKREPSLASLELCRSINSAKINWEIVSEGSETLRSGEFLYGRRL